MANATSFFDENSLSSTQTSITNAYSSVLQNQTAVNSFTFTQPSVAANGHNNMLISSDSHNALPPTPDLHIEEIQDIPPWRPVQQLRSIHTRFKNTILYQHICVPCVYCARLLYPQKAKWVLYNENAVYPIQIHFPETDLVFTGETPSLKISVCNSCNNKTKRYPCPQLHPIPLEIEQVPIMQRRFLSPVFLHCSLGRTSDGSPFSQYRAVTGEMGFSKNMRALKLYSGMLGAFLSDPSQQNNESISWLSPELLDAAKWLQTNNSYLKAYSNLLANPRLLSSLKSGPFPTAEHSKNDPRPPPFLERDIVVSANDFPLEIHNEDAHYARLMAGFVRTRNDTSLPLSFSDPELEPLLFPDLLPNGKGHFHDKTHFSSDSSTISETYGKYIKHRLLCCDPRFRLHPYWPSWSYLQLEKLRNHQNSMRIWRQQQSDKIYKPPTAAQLITQSVYTGERIIDETQPSTLPTFI